MKQFKAKWQPISTDGDYKNTVAHLITQHNALIDYLEEREVEKHLPNYDLNDPRGWEEEKTNNSFAQRCPAPNWDLTDRNHKLPETPKIITIPKPEWWEREVTHTDNPYENNDTYLEALKAASKASGILFTLED